MKVFVLFLFIIVAVVYGIAGNLYYRVNKLEKDSKNMHKRISDLVERVDEIEWK